MQRNGGCKGRLSSDNPIKHITNPLQKRPRGLLDLPPELWSHICHLALLSDEPVPLASSYISSKNFRLYGISTPAITQVCRVIREELGCLDGYCTKHDFIHTHESDLGPSVRGAHFKIWIWLQKHEHQMRGLFLDVSLDRSAGWIA